MPKIPILNKKINEFSEFEKTYTDDGVPLFLQNSPSSSTNLMDAALLKLDLQTRKVPRNKKYSAKQKKNSLVQKNIADWDYVTKAEKNKNFTQTYREAKKLYKEAEREEGSSLRSFTTTKSATSSKLRPLPEIAPLQLDHRVDPVKRARAIRRPLRPNEERIYKRDARDILSEQKRKEGLYRDRDILSDYLSQIENQYKDGKTYLAPTIKRLREELSGYNTGGVVKRKKRKPAAPKKKPYSRGSRKAKYKL